MNVVTATKTKKTSDPEKVVSFEELNTRKLREKMEAYRDYVRRAADGEMIAAEQLEVVGENLAYMHLPEMCWERDVRALREYREATAAAEEMAGKQADLDLETSQLVAKIQQLEAELKAARTRLNYCGKVAPMVHANQLRRAHELTIVHPHLLLDLDQAVALRAEARAKAYAKQIPAKTLEGWSN
jgi:multidrug efflux pump subunit AcrA (membrane-fusion protein)